MLEKVGNSLDDTGLQKKDELFTENTVNGAFFNCGDNTKGRVAKERYSFMNGF